MCTTRPEGQAGYVLCGEHGSRVHGMKIQVRDPGYLGWGRRVDRGRGCQARNIQVLSKDMPDRVVFSLFAGSGAGASKLPGKLNRFNAESHCVLRSRGPHSAGPCYTE
jgi:hypothetical protein